MVAHLAHAADADPYGISRDDDSSASYAAAFDRETAGLFREVVSKGDPQFAMDAYGRLIGAYVTIEDALFDANSHHANRLPSWYAGQLRAAGLDALKSPESLAFFEAELSSGDFDRVVHAYYVLSRSRLPLLAAEAPTLLWMKMIAVAKADSADRFWISLALAEARMLPVTSYERRRTKMATRVESVRERIGKNADFLGARIPRILGLSEGDARVAHLRIRYAEQAAEQRVREHRLAARGADAAYQGIRDELERMETGAFESRRFLEVMQQDLPFLLTRFGPPPDPEVILETLRVLCRGLGQNRMVLWNAADGVAKLYVPIIEDQAIASPPAARPDAAAVLAMGDGAVPHLLATLRDVDDPEGILDLFERDTIVTVVAERPPIDPDALRRAVRHGYYAVGYPPGLRPAFLRATGALGPEPSAQAEQSRRALETLAAAFSGAKDAPGFAAAFEDFRRASAKGRLPARDVDPEFLARFALAAIRILEAEREIEARASERTATARAARAAASAAIEDAEARVAAANTAIREANAEAVAQEARQEAAMVARNDAVARLNASVERANRAARTLDEASHHAVRAEARQLEADLSAVIEEQEAAFHAAGRAIRAAEERASSEAARARREQARAPEEFARENEALEAERLAQTDGQKSRARASEVRGRLIAGLGFVGIESDTAAVGDPARPPSVRIASLALLAERDGGPAGLEAAIQRETESDDSAVRRLATLVLVLDRDGR